MQPPLRRPEIQQDLQASLQPELAAWPDDHRRSSNGSKGGPPAPQSAVNLSAALAKPSKSFSLAVCCRSFIEVLRTLRHQFRHVASQSSLVPSRPALACQ